MRLKSGEGRVSTVETVLVRDNDEFYRGHRPETLGTDPNTSQCIFLYSL